MGISDKQLFITGYKGYVYFTHFKRKCVTKLGKDISLKCRRESSLLKEKRKHELFDNLKDKLYRFNL